MAIEATILCMISGTMTNTVQKLVISLHPSTNNKLTYIISMCISWFMVNKLVHCNPCGFYTAPDCYVIYDGTLLTTGSSY